MSLNPEGPTHWLYTEWICKAAEKTGAPAAFYDGR